MVGRLRLGLTGLAILYAIALASLFGLVAGGGARAGWTAILREALHFLLVPIPLLALAVMVLRARAALLLAMLPIAPLAGLYGPQLVPGGPAAAAGPRRRVLSLNVGGYRGLTRPEAVLRTLRAVDPDLVCLVEARRPAADAIDSALAGSHPYRVDGRDVVVIGRFPLLDARPAELGDGAHDGLLVDAEIEGRLVRVAVVHLRRIDPLQGSWRAPLSLLRAMAAYRPAPRDATAAELIVRLNQVGGPRLLVGDFNMTEWSYAHALVTRELRDSYREAAWGLGHTYPATPAAVGLPMPLLRIDYVFHSAELAAERAWVGPDAGSDHLPVVADLAFR